MNRKKIVLALSFLAFCFAGIFCQPKTSTKTQTNAQEEAEQEPKKEEPQRVTLTVEEALQHSLENSKNLQSSAIDLEIKKRAKSNAWNTFIPDVGINATLYRLTDEPSRLKAVPLDFNSEKDHWGSVADLSVGLNLSLAQIYAIKSAYAAYESGEITWNQVVKENNKNIRTMFYGILLSQESLKIAKASLENSRQRMEQARKNYNNGLIPELALLNTQVDYEAKKPDVLQQEQTVEQNLDMFAFLIGLPVGTKITLDGKIEAEFKDVDADELLKQYAQNSVDILALKKQLDTLHLQKKALDMSSFTPYLALNYNYNPTLAYSLDKDGVTVPSYTDGGFLGPSDWDDSGKFSLTLGWKLSDMLPWSSNRQQAKDLDSNIKKLEISLEQLIDNTEIEIRTKVDNLTLARANIKTSKDRTNLAQRSYDMTLRSYRNGTTELLDLRDAENSLNQAKLAMANEQYKYITNLLELEYLINAKIY